MTDSADTAERKLKRFEDLARKLLSVPKHELDAEREAEKKPPRRKRQPKTT